MEHKVQATQLTGDKYAPRGWKKKKKDTFEIEFPDQVILVRRLGMKQIIKAGLIIDLDTFTGQLLPQGTKSGDAEPDPNSIILEAMKDEKKFDEFEQTVDKVVMMCVIAPKIHPALPEDYDRDESKMYIDEIEIEDKLTIFGHVFAGMGDMSRFPGEPSGDLEPVAEVSGSSVAAEHHGGVPSGVS